MTVNAAEQGSGTITFSGAVIDAPCSVNPDASEQDVYLGQVALHQLSDGGSSKPRDFKINLENCAYIDDGAEVPEGRALVAPSVKVKFEGVPADGDDDTAFATRGDASGIGVVITDKSGKPIKVGGESDARELLAGNNALGFSAYVLGMGKDVSVGEFESIVDFSLSYE